MANQSNPGTAANHRRARVWRLRRRILAVSLACLILFLGVVTIRMAVGGDPIFGDSSSRTAAGSASEANTTNGSGSVDPEGTESTEPLQTRQS